MPKPDKIVYLYIYNDGDDQPYMIVNPPDNLNDLLKEWNKLDRIEPQPEEWKPVNEWLAAKGVQLREADEIIILDNV